MGSAYRCVSMEKLQRFDEPRGPGANGTRRVTTDSAGTANASDGYLSRYKIYYVRQSRRPENNVTVSPPPLLLRCRKVCAAMIREAVRTRTAVADDCCRRRRGPFKCDGYRLWCSGSPPNGEPLFLLFADIIIILYKYLYIMI